MTDQGQSNEIELASDANPSESRQVSLANRLLSHDVKVESKRRLTDARTVLFQSEQDMISEARSFAAQVQDQTQEIKQRAESILIEARSIEAEAVGRAEVMLKHAKLERDLAETIKNIAEANALAVLDKVRDASDSMIGWAQEVASDLGSMMKEEAANEAARKMGDINAARDAMEDETRAGELLKLASELKQQAA